MRELAYIKQVSFADNCFFFDVQLINRLVQIKLDIESEDYIISATCLLICVGIPNAKNFSQIIGKPFLFEVGLNGSFMLYKLETKGKPC